MTELKSPRREPIYKLGRCGRGAGMAASLLFFLTASGVTGSSLLQGALAASPPSPSSDPGSSQTASYDRPPGLMAAATTPLPPAISPEEAKIGKEAVKEVEKEYQVVKDPVATAHLQAIVNTLEKGTVYPDLPYTVKIVKSRQKDAPPEINAFSLPGGYIYVTKDLLDSVQSDDELAAVLGHEMGHVIHHHEIKQMKARKHDSVIAMLATAAALLAEHGHPGEGTLDVFMMGPQVVQALMSPNSIEDETQADMSGIDTLYASHKYNPVGMLTFMQRLMLDERHHAPFDWGYLQDHPSSAHRVEDIRARLQALHVPIDVRAVSNVLTAVVRTDSTEGDATVCVRQSKKQTDICTFRASLGGLSPAQRAEVAAKAINEGVDKGEEMADLLVRTGADGADVTWGGLPLFTITSRDAAPGDAKEAAQNAVQQIRRTIWVDLVDKS